ncbi:MAG: AMP-binding protein [Acidiferrobacterales bacterium]|nr:AMP-binding protein [Acidiferrobacterales bacterium]
MKTDHLRLIRPEWGDWDAIRERFAWNVPEFFNIAYVACDRHAQADGDRIAIYCENKDGSERQYSFRQLKRLSNCLANVLRGHGVEKGDRVGIILPQRSETVISHMGIYKLGAIALPLSVLFGPEAVGYRLNNSGTKVVITDTEHLELLESMRDQLPGLETIIDCDADNGFWSALDKASDEFEMVNTKSEDPAYLVYTSGTTGPPKGALAPHRCLIGNLPGFEMSHNFFPQEHDLFWTPADWAWTGGLLDALIPSLYYAVPVLGYDGGKFDPEKICHLLEKYRVRNAFIPPTALKMLRQVPGIREGYDIDMRSIMSAGESLGSELYHWGQEAFGVNINEMWAQTEFNYICGNCSAIMPVCPGSIGKSYPGHTVEPIDEEGNAVEVGAIGELAADRDDPVMVSGYWKNEAATQEKYVGKWWVTGDTGYKDENGYIWFVGRKDDVISSAGYRIGPGEIEDCLLKHPAIAQVAVIGVPDEMRGEIVKAFVVLKPGEQASGELTENIRSSVRRQLAAYEYPRIIEYIDDLPLTTTGKVKRNELRARESRSDS